MLLLLRNLRIKIYIVSFMSPCSMKGTEQNLQCKIRPQKYRCYHESKNSLGSHTSDCWLDSLAGPLCVSNPSFRRSNFWSLLCWCFWSLLGFCPIHRHVFWALPSLEAPPVKKKDRCIFKTKVTSAWKWNKRWRKFTGFWEKLEKSYNRVFIQLLIRHLSVSFIL